MYLPIAMPKLSAIESVWKGAEYRLATAEHYETQKDLMHAVPEYFRACSIDSTSTNFCTTAYESKFSMIVILVPQ